MNKGDPNTLSVLGKTLEAGLRPLAPRHRPISIGDIDAYPAGVELTAGLFVLTVEHDHQVAAQLLSAYARQQAMPEYETTLFCTPQTSTEDLQNFVARWALSHGHGRSNRLYCLAGIQVLSYRVQQAIVNSLKDAVPNAKNPLLIISKKAQHLTSVFEEYRISYMLPLPEKCLQQLGGELSAMFSLGVHCHSSSSSGSGKTFNILTEATRMEATYVHIPINNDLPSTDLIHRIKEQISKGSPSARLLLHFDMTD